MRAMVTALIVGALVLVAASPAKAPAAHGQPTFFDIYVELDPTGLVERANGALTLPRDVAPRSGRAYLLEDVQVVREVDGREVFVREVRANFDPATPAAGEIRGVVVLITPLDENEPCRSGRGIPATAEVTYDDGTPLQSIQARIACPGAAPAPRILVFSDDPIN